MRIRIQQLKLMRIRIQIRNPGKIHATSENQADGKILAPGENQADGKILAPGEKYQRPWKCWRNWKSRLPAYCLGSAESPTADFSLVPLMSTFSSSLM
jgi:hypothetical protein